MKTVKFEPVKTTTATMKKRKAHTKVTDEMIKQMIELEQEGYNQSEISELVGISQSCVCRHLKKAAPMKTHLTLDEKAMIVAMKKDGKTSKFIAGKMHRGLSTVDKVWAEYRQNGKVSAPDKPVVYKVKKKIHRRGNELRNVDVSKLDKLEPPLIHPEKESSSEIVMWLMLAAVVFILGLAFANV